MIQRNFKLALTAGRTIPLVIPASQYDSGEQWIFTLIDETGAKYTPATGAIIGLKSDKTAILNAGTVDAAGRVVINETEQMTAAVGKNVYEILIDDQTHGSANFIVMVEPRPGDNADFSDSDLSLLQQAIDGTSETAIKAGVQEWMNENLTDPTDPIVDASLSLSGAAADAKKTGDEISDLKSAISQGSGLTNEAKTALLELLQHVAYADDDGQDYYDALETALNPPTNLSYITAVYTQGSTIVYDTDSLDSLRSNLVVTAHYDDLTTETVTSYTLSGTLTEGTSTITVTYSGKTTTFNVTVTERTYGWYYQFNNSIESVGTKDFGWTGPTNFGEGVNGQAFHKVSGTDPVKTILRTNKPNLSGDFTFAAWFKQPNNDANTYILCNHDAAKGSGHTLKQSLSSSDVTMHDTNWTYTVASIGAYQDMAGFTFFYAASLLALRGWDDNGNATGFQIRFTPPSTLDRTEWNHYAVTRNGSTIMVFVNGHKIASFTCSYPLYFANRVTFGATFTERTSTDTIDSGSSTHEAYYDDMYLNDTLCKWTADFDPETIVY